MIFRKKSMALFFSGAITIAMISTPTYAKEYSPQRLGSFAGAMKFCADEDGAWSDRYRSARRNAAREVDRMSRQDKSQAMSARDRTYDNGRFMGKRLDQKQCRSLLRQAEWNSYR